MFSFNKDSITLINVVPSSDGKPSYHITFFNNVDWQESVGVKFLKTTGTRADIDNKILVFIPYNNHSFKTYLPPKQFKSTEKKDKYFTFNEGEDLIIRGIVDIEIKDSADFKNLMKNYDDVVKVVNITKCDLTKHFEIGCD